MFNVADSIMNAIKKLMNNNKLVYVGTVDGNRMFVCQPCTSCYGSCADRCDGSCISMNAVGH